MAPLLPPEAPLGDPLLADRIRLGILVYLSRMGPQAFVALRDALGLTDGNLATHGRRLEDAGYVTVVRDGVRRERRTTYAIAPAGRRALVRHATHLRAVLDHISGLGNGD